MNNVDENEIIDHLKNFNLDSSSTPLREDDIKKQYRKLAKLYHPDIGNDKTGLMMSKINETKKFLLEHLEEVNIFIFEKTNSNTQDPKNDNLDDRSNLEAILEALRNNQQESLLRVEIVVENGEIKVVRKDVSNEEYYTKVSTSPLSTKYWYKDNPILYQKEKKLLDDMQQELGANNFTYFEGMTNEENLYFVLNIRVKIAPYMSNYMKHKFLMVYGKNYQGVLTKEVKVYPADPDENYYYHNGVIFPYLTCTDESGRHILNFDNFRELNIVHSILKWLGAFYRWRR